MKVRLFARARAYVFGPPVGHIFQRASGSSAAAPNTHLLPSSGRTRGASTVAAANIGSVVVRTTTERLAVDSGLAATADDIVTFEIAVD